MLEGIGAYLINYYLGEFLEDINNDQLSGAHAKLDFVSI